MSVPTDKANFYSDPERKPTIPLPAWDAIPEVLRMAVRPQAVIPREGDA